MTARGPIALEPDKPAWVEDWLWVEYSRVMKYARLIVEDSPEVPLAPPALLTSIVCSRSMVDAWKALRRREDSPSSVYVTEQNEYGSASSLLFEIQQLFAGALFDEKVPRSVRKARGTKLGKMARALVKEIDEIVELSGGQLPVEILDSIQSLGQVTHQRAIDAARLHDIAVDQDVQALVHSFYDVGPQEALRALAEGADTWADSKPLVTHQTDDDDARRLYFIRGLTRYFRCRFDEPLREVTAAITRVAFDCEMDAATVSKLAR